MLLHLICYHARLAEPFHRMDGPCPGRRQGIYITSIYIASRQIFTPESSLRSKGYYQHMMMMVSFWLFQLFLMHYYNIENIVVLITFHSIKTEVV